MDSRQKAKRGGSVKRGGTTQLGSEIQSKIGAQLRAMYDDVVSEGVPDRFADLLRQIEDPAAKKSE
jgi:hypothetical protein